MIEKDAPQLRLRNKPFFARRYLRIREKIRQLIGKIEIGTDRTDFTSRYFNFSEFIRLPFLERVV